MATNPIDRNGALLRSGDRVLNATGSGIVMRAEGTLIDVRLDSTGEYLSSAAKLWAKEETAL